MTPFYYYALILTLGLFMYYAALIAKDMYGKPKGEGNTSESIDTDGITEDVHQDTPPGPSNEENDTDDESGAREWNEDDDKEDNNDIPDDNKQEYNGQNPDDVPATDDANDSEQHNDEPEQSEEQQPSPRPYYEDNDEVETPSHGDEDSRDENQEAGNANQEKNADNANTDNSNSNELSQGKQFDQSALGLTPELIAYMEEHGSMVVNDVKPIEDLDLKAPDPEPEYEVTQTFEPKNEDAQMVAAQANSCQEKIEPKSDNAVPCGVLNKMFNQRLNNALSNNTDNENHKDPTNNILSRHVQERC